MPLLPSVKCALTVTVNAPNIIKEIFIVVNVQSIVKVYQEQYLTPSMTKIQNVTTNKMELKV